MSWTDIIIGWSTVAAMMALQYLLVKKFPLGDIPTSTSAAIDHITTRRIIPMTAKAGRHWAAKQGIGVASGVSRMLFTDGPADANFVVGAPGMHVQVGLSKDHEGEYAGKAKARFQHLETGQADDPEFPSINPRTWGSPL